MGWAFLNAILIVLPIAWAIAVLVQLNQSTKLLRQISTDIAALRKTPQANDRLGG